MSKPTTCENCSLTWTRDHNVKDIVLCPLHAAAPALLAALEHIAEICDTHTPALHPLRDIARAAIAQAKETK